MTQLLEPNQRATAIKQNESNGEPKLDSDFEIHCMEVSGNTIALEDYSSLVGMLTMVAMANNNQKYGCRLQAKAFYSKQKVSGSESRGFWLKVTYVETEKTRFHP
ncbi:hypothetical protein ACLOJK_021075 [Asimina triloba]